jgi:uncharacterized damage-inducible protein DinB
MALNEMLLPEFDHEMVTTRKFLDRVPDDKFAWKPHDKSMSLGQLVAHLAEMPGWAVPTLKQDSLDLAPPGGPPFQPAKTSSRQETLDLFDKNVATARNAIARAADEALMKPWSLLTGGKVIFTMPRIGVVRNMIMNHSVHHRAQLGVYFRLNNIPVPSAYGPTADES